MILVIFFIHVKIPFIRALTKYGIDLKFKSELYKSLINMTVKSTFSFDLDFKRRPTIYCDFSNTNVDKLNKRKLPQYIPNRSLHIMLYVYKIDTLNLFSPFYL